MAGFGRFFIEKNQIHRARSEVKSSDEIMEDVSQLLPSYLNSSFSIQGDTTVRDFFELLKPIKNLLSTIFQVYNFEEYYNYGLNNDICVREMWTGTLPWEYMSIKYEIKHQKGRNRHNQNKIIEYTGLSTRVQGISIPCTKEHSKTLMVFQYIHPKLEKETVYFYGDSISLYTWI